MLQQTIYLHHTDLRQHCLIARPSVICTVFGFGHVSKKLFKTTASPM